jgi:hypothetical protein
MSKHRIMQLLVLAAVAAGCGSDGPGEAVSPEYVPVMACLGVPLDVLFEALADAAEAAQGLKDPANPPAGMQIVPGVLPGQWSFEVGGMSGDAIFSDDPLDGVAPGDSVEISWAYPAASVSANGTFVIVFGEAGTFTLSGVATIGVPDDDCFLEAAIAAEDPLAVSTGVSGGNLGDIDVAGVVHLDGTSDGDLDADLTFASGSDEITLGNVVIDGAPAAGVTLPLPSRNPGAFDGDWSVIYSCSDGTSGSFDLTIRHGDGAATASGNGVDPVFGAFSFVGTVAGDVLTWSQDHGGGLVETTTYTLTSPTSFSKGSTGRDATGIQWTCSGVGTRD